MKLVMGHFAYGLHQVVPGPYTYATMLRQPIARVLSAYSMMVRERDPRVFEGTRPIGIEDYLEESADSALSNLQTKVISGDISIPCERRSSELQLALERAKYNLVNAFSSVGLTEYFNCSLLLYAREFGWPRWRLYYVERNVGGSAIEIPKNTKTVVEEYNHYDLELYGHAQSLFLKSLSELDHDLGKELASFDTYGKYLGVANSAFEAANSILHREIGIRQVMRKYAVGPLLRR